MKTKLVLTLFILFTTLSMFSCAHIPKNEIGKEKIILVHGFGRSTFAMNYYEDYLTEQGYQVFSIGYSSMTQDIDGVQSEFFNKVNQSLLGVTDKVHFVGHSMGGLLVRSYLDKNKVKNLGNVVTVGSPNKGTPLVEYFKDKWYFSFAGPAVNSLGASGSRFLKSLKQPFYNLGVIAGYKSQGSMAKIIPGVDDGVVPFESTKVEGMKDFLAMPESHYSMRYSEKVMQQVQYFLKHGTFNRSKVVKL